MAATFQLDPSIASLVKAIGLVDADGNVNSEFLKHPLTSIRSALKNDAQRAAVLELLNQVLGTVTPDDQASPPGAQWHPLLDAAGRGNVYITVEGDDIGVVLQIGTDPQQEPGARVRVALPLISVAGGGLTPLAGTPAGPLAAILEVTWAGDVHPSGVLVRVTIDTAGNGEVHVGLQNLDLGDGPLAQTVLDPANLGAQAVQVVLALIQDQIRRAAPEDSATGRVLAHLPGVLGLIPGLPPLPLHRMVAEPAAFSSWLGSILDMDGLKTWFKHLAGLLGAGLDDGHDPVISGDGTPEDPYVTALLAADGDPLLSLGLASSTDPSSGVSSLLPSVQLNLAATAAGLECLVTLAAIPLDGHTSATVLPHARITARCPADTASTLINQGGVIAKSLVAGVIWNGAALTPQILLTGVWLDGHEYGDVDLGNAQGVVETASAIVSDKLEELLGAGNAARALLALIGLRAPVTDVSSPNRIALAALTSNPPRAIGEFHRTVLASAGHDWSHLLAELAVLLGLPVVVQGQGMRADPWSVRVAQVGDAELSVVAWNDRSAQTPSGVQLLRLGLRLQVVEDFWGGTLLVEVLAFDLQPGGGAAVRLFGGYHLDVTAGPVEIPGNLLGIGLGASAVYARCDWTPGMPATWAAGLADAVLTAEQDSVGPLDLSLSSATFDPAAPDLGLGLSVPDLTAALRLLVTQALLSWGDLPALTAGALLGVHRHLPGLPPDWPLLEPPDPDDLGSLFRAPLTALKAHAGRVMLGSSADGTPFGSTALAWLQALVLGQLPNRIGQLPSTPITGNGSYEDPWALGLADGALEVLGWAEPGPSAAALGLLGSRLRSATDGQTLSALVASLTSGTGQPPSAAAWALRGRDPVAAGQALERLVAWLAGSDGVVPLSSQLAVPPSWQIGDLLDSCHLDQPADPRAIDQVERQLDTWTGSVEPGAVILLGPSFAAPEAWAELMAVLDPVRPPDAAVDLSIPGIDPLTVSLDDLTAVARCYPVVLADADLDGQVAQLDRVVARIADLTDQQRVFLVGHSTGGVLARVYGTSAPERVAGVITIGTPHAAAQVAPLTEPELADAIRIAAAMTDGGPEATVSPAPLRAVQQLMQIITATGRRRPPSAFDGVPPDTLDRTPGLAIAARVDAQLVGILGDVLAEQVWAVPAQVPTRLGLGLRTPFLLGATAPGDLVVTGSVRVDAARLDLAGATGAQPRPRVVVRGRIERPGDWLTGGPARSPGEPLIRIRWAECGADLEAAPEGGLACTPMLRLHDAAVPGIHMPLLDLDQLVARLPQLPSQIPVAAPAIGSTAETVITLLDALGFVTRAGADQAVSTDAIAAFSSQPLAQLGPRLPAMISALAPVIGAVGPPEGPWTWRPTGTALELVLAQQPWSLAASAGAGLAGLPLAEVLGVDLAAQVTLPRFTGSITVTARAGDAALSASSASRRLILSVPGWIEPLSLLSDTPEQIRDALLEILPRIAVSAALSAVLESRIAPDLRVGSLDGLFTSPLAWLLRPEHLGTADGSRFSPAKVAALLTAAGTSLGLPAGPAGGFLLPGGLNLRAIDADPLRITLSGGLLERVPPAAADPATFDIGLELDAAGAAHPAGALTLDLPLPGADTWGSIAIAFTLTGAGVGLTVTPSAANPPVTITLLPSFSGFDTVAQGAAQLLPRVLQATTDELMPANNQPTGLLAAGLGIAEALGVYHPDPAPDANGRRGFEREPCVTELAAMFEPGWLQSKVPQAPAIAAALAGAFGPAPLIDVPIGEINRAGGALRWSLDLPGGGTVHADLGFATIAGAVLPHLELAAGDLALGPVVVRSASLGYHDGPRFALRLQLEPGGVVSFLRPLLALDADDRRFAVRVFPLGDEAAADITISLAPAPALDVGVDASMALIEAWVIPLVTSLLLDAFAGDPLTLDMYTGGPTVREVLDGSGLIAPGSDPPALAAVRPAPQVMALRALQSVVSDVEVEIPPSLRLRFVTSTDNRFGVQLHGRIRLPGDGPVIDVLMGDASWVSDQDGGVTLWLIEPAAGAVPLRITPSLQVGGLGVSIVGADGDNPLIDGAVRVGAIAGAVSFRVHFLTATRTFELKVDDLAAGLDVSGAQIVVSSDDADSFLKKVMPPALQAPFDLTVAWVDEALYLAGGDPGAGSGIDLAFPLDVDLTLIRLTELLLGLRTQQSVEVQAAVSADVDIGPIHASIIRVGFAARFGTAGAGLRFRAPDGVGLSIDTGVVSGGGFLYIDEAKGQYAGGLQLKLTTLSITAIGLLNTKLPDGSPIRGPGGLPGFSLLIIIAVELPPIQLGFGFTLNGIGGLLGLNRTMDLDALRAGVRNRALDSMLFPPDPAGNAAAVVRTLSAVFPVALDRFVIGPMIRLGWGTPAILTLDLAVLIELPAPVRLVILGRMRLALPPGAEETLVEINLDSVGVLDFGAGEVSIDASLYDSKIAGFSLSGDMALRARWHGEPAFALAIGGFHPSFAPPTGFPMLRRITLSLSSSDNPRLRLEAYLAVTSNTLQLGGRVDLHAETAGFAVDGTLSFDALIQFSPFGFRVDFGAAAAVSAGGHVLLSISLDVHLTGPAPWHVWGKGSFEVLGIGVEVSFDSRIGASAAFTPIEPVNVASLLADALRDAANWTCLPPGDRTVVALRTPPGTPGVVAHPIADLAVRQRVVPLGVAIQSFGAAAVEGPNRFSIDSMSRGGVVVNDDGLDPLHDYFAPAPFFKMTQAQQLTMPSFQTMESGRRLRFDGYDVDNLAAAEAATLDYELILVDKQAPPPPAGKHPTIRMPMAPAVALAAAGPAGNGPAARSGTRRFATDGITLAVDPIPAQIPGQGS